MGTGLKELWKLESPRGKSLNSQAAVFKTSFEEQLRMINTSLQYTAANADSQWHKEQVSKRDKLLAVYQSVLREHQRNSTAAPSVGEKALHAARALAIEVTRYKVGAEQSAADWQDAQEAYDAALSMTDQLEEAGDEKSVMMRNILTKIQKHADRKDHKTAARTTRKLAEGMGLGGRKNGADKAKSNGSSRRRAGDPRKPKGKSLKLGLQTLFLSNFEAASVDRLIKLIKHPKSPTISLAVNVAFTNPGKEPFANIEKVIEGTYKDNPIRLTVYLGFHEKYVNEPNQDEVHLDFTQCIDALNAFLTKTFVTETDNGPSPKSYLDAIKQLCICPSLEDNFPREEGTVPENAESNFEKAVKQIASVVSAETLASTKIQFRRSVAEAESADSLNQDEIKIDGVKKAKKVTHEFHHILKDSDEDDVDEVDATGYDVYSPDGPFVYDPRFEKPDSLKEPEGNTPNPPPQTIDEFIENVKSRPNSVKEVLLWRPPYNLQKDDDPNDGKLHYDSENHLSRSDEAEDGYGFSKREARIARKFLRELGK